MEESTIYRELEAMIEKDFLVKSPSEIDQMLKALEKDGRITLGEYRSLIELYLGKTKKIS
jgi:hypothetical protein